MLGIVFVAAVMLVVAYVIGLAMGHEKGWEDRAELARPILPPRWHTPEDRVLGAGVIATKCVEVPVRVPVVNYDRMGIRTLYTVGRQESRGERERLPGWDKVYLYYETSDQAHRENPGKPVREVRVIEIDGHLYGSKLLENIEPLTVQAKPKRGQGKK